MKLFKVLKYEYLKIAKIAPSASIVYHFWYFLFESKRLPTGDISDGPSLAELCFKQPLDTASEEDIRAV